MNSVGFVQAYLRFPYVVHEQRHGNLVRGTVAIDLHSQRHTFSDNEYVG